MALTFKQDFTQSTLAAAATSDVTGNPTLTFDRASGATYFNNVGTLVRAPENLILQSEDWTTTWAGTPPVITANVASPPVSQTSYSDADKIEDDTGAFKYSRSNTMTVTVGDKITASIWVLKDTVPKATRFPVFRMTFVGESADVAFDTMTGEVGAQSGNEPDYTPTVTTDGLYWRVEWTHDAHSTTFTMDIYPGAGSGSDLSTYSTTIGDVTVWGAQVSRSLGTPATFQYVPTTTTDLAQPRLAAHTVSATFPWINRGVLIEEARTNLCLQSEDLSTTWSELGGIETPVQGETAPDNAATAWTIDDQTAGDLSRIRQTVTITANDSTYCFSFFVKKNTTDTNRIGFSLFLQTGGTTADSEWTFNRNDGTLTARTGNFAGAASDVEDYGGWWRVWCTQNDQNDGNTNAQFRILPAVATSDTGTWANSATGDCIVWGAQLEVGAFPTSYIPSTTAATERAFDDLDTTDVSWLDTAATARGTFVANAMVSVLSTADQRQIIHIDDGTNDDRVATYLETDSKAIVYSQNSVGDNGYGTSVAAVVAGTSFEIAAAYADDSEAISLDDATAVDETPCSFPLSDSITNLRVGSRLGTSEFFNGYIKDIRYWNERKPNLWLESPPAMGAENDTRIKYDFSRNTLADAVILGPTPVFSRASNATYFNNAGTLTFIGENRLTYSQVFENAAWEDGGFATDNTGDVTDPNGGNTAASLADNQTNPIYQGSITCTENTTYTFSYYARAGVGTAVLCEFFDETGSGFFGPGLETAITTGAWTRITYTATTPASCVSMRVYPNRSPSGGVDGNVYLWGAQVETGAGVSDYLVTTATARTDRPRLASHLYDGTSWSNHGYLTETERTNYCLDSDNYDVSGNWSDSGGPLPTTQDETGPDGVANSAWTIEDDNGSQWENKISNQVTVANGETYCGSFRIKKDAIPKATRFMAARFNFTNGGSASTDIMVDTSTGETAIRVSPISCTVVDSGSINEGDWWRIYIVVTLGAAATNLAWWIYPAMGAGDLLLANYDATVTGSIVLANAQIEAGASATPSVPGPSTYIPTTTASVTRSGDYMYLENSTAEPANELGAYGYGDLNEGSWVAKFTSPIAQNIEDFDNYVLYGVGDGFMFIESTDSDLNAYNNAVLDYAGGGGYAIAATTQYEAIIAWEPSIPGSKTLVDDITNETDGSVYSADPYTGDWEMSTIDLGIGNYGTSGIANLNGHIKEVRFWDYQFSDAEMADPPRFSIASGMLLLGVG